MIFLVESVVDAIWFNQGIKSIKNKDKIIDIDNKA